MISDRRQPVSVGVPARMLGVLRVDSAADSRSAAARPSRGIRRAVADYLTGRRQRRMSIASGSGAAEPEKSSRQGSASGPAWLTPWWETSWGRRQSDVDPQGYMATLKRFSPFKGWQT